MSRIVLMAETGADIPPERANRYGIHIVPMHVSFGDVSKDDLYITVPKLQRRGGNM